MNYCYDQISDETRLRQIAGILAKGVTLTLIKDQHARSSPARCAADKLASLDCSPSQMRSLSAVLEYIVKGGGLFSKGDSTPFLFVRENDC